VCPQRIVQQDLIAELMAEAIKGLHAMSVIYLWELSQRW